MSSLSEQNWLIVGLGNPGLRYEKTRHNLGFLLVDLLARQNQTQVKRDECRSLVGRAVIENQTAELIKPQTFMNLSGEAISCLLKKENRSAAKLIVTVDDLALPFGSIRLRARGSSGGHNGLKSIIACLGTEEFIRLRIGIQPEHPLNDTKKFVLENFSKSETDTVEKVLEESAEAIQAVLRDGVEKAMAQYN
ncbi:MAG TPA: aminoacyl-tRNA hydrolase [Pyrinomonadaceae bacterium]|jgi:PTH1 family peptidyl-tRNA hydrolase